MRNFIIGVLVGLILATLTVAVASDISGEKLWNRVFDSTLNTIKIQGV